MPRAKPRALVIVADGQKSTFSGPGWHSPAPSPSTEKRLLEAERIQPLMSKVRTEWVALFRVTVGCAVPWNEQTGMNLERCAL
jgi:hypothetical protein